MCSAGRGLSSTQRRTTKDSGPQISKLSTLSSERSEHDAQKSSYGERSRAITISPSTAPQVESEGFGKCQHDTARVVGELDKVQEPHELEPRMQHGNSQRALSSLRTTTCWKWAQRNEMSASGKLW